MLFALVAHSCIDGLLIIDHAAGLHSQEAVLHKFVLRDDLVNELVVHSKALGVLLGDAVDKLAWFVCEELVVENSLNALLAVTKDVRALTLLELGQLGEADLNNAFLEHQRLADLAALLNENLILTIGIIESRL